MRRGFELAESEHNVFEEDIQEEEETETSELKSLRTFPSHTPHGAAANYLQLPTNGTEANGKSPAGRPAKPIKKLGTHTCCMYSQPRCTTPALRQTPHVVHH